MLDSYDVIVFSSFGIYSSMEGGKHMIKMNDYPKEISWQNVEYSPWLLATVIEYNVHKEKEKLKTTVTCKKYKIYL